MNTTIFISHKKEDSGPAEYVCSFLKKLGVNAYLDLLEGDLLLKGEALTNHIKKRLNSCTDLLVIMSDNTEKSWWVPFEIGMASQNDFPIVTYLINNVPLPDYLTYWPTLKKSSDLVKYINVKKSILTENYKPYKQFNAKNTNISETKQFYDKLKKELNY
ncbi:TPA: TIR domain-containing protein [Clostridium perfringens]